jgi:hypothetical protein
MSNKIQCSWKVYDSLQELIKFADLKAGVIITVYALVGGVMLPKLLDYTGLFYSHILFIFIQITAIFSCISLLFAIRCIFPRRYSSKSHSMIFYGDINSYPNGKKYALEFGKKFSNDFQSLNDIACQNYILSSIVKEKFENIAWSSYAFVLSTITMMISLMIIITK